MTSLLRFPFEISGLRTLLREATVDVRSWRQVLRALAAPVPGTEGEIVFRPRAGRTIAARFQRTAEHLPTGPMPGGRLVARVTDPAAARGTCRDDTIGLDLLRTATGVWRLTLEPPAGVLETHAAGGRRLQSTLDRLGGEIRDAFALSSELAAERAPSPTRLAAAWDPLAFGVALTDDRLRPVFTNTAADDLAATRWLFRPAGGRGSLRLAPVGPALALEQAVDEVVAGDAPAAGVTVPGSAGRPTIRIRVARLGANELDWPPRTQLRRPPTLLVVTMRAADEAAPAHPGVVVPYRLPPAAAAESALRPE